MLKFWAVRYAAAILFLTSLLFSCNKDNSLSQVDFGYDYYPTEIGSYLIYDVDSISYNDFTVPPSIDTFTFQIREVYESTFVDFAGDTVVRVEQYKRDSSSAAWEIMHIASVKITDINAQKTVNDLRFVKFPFPPSVGVDWEGHIYLDILDNPALEYLDRTRYDWRHRVSELNVSKDFGGFTFDSCATVIQIDEENLFEKKYSEEIYAKDVGLVYKQQIILETQAPPTGESFFDRAEKGFILIYTINEIG